MKPPAAQGSGVGSRQRLAVFDLDEVLIDSRRAWQYAVEEAVAAVSGRRVSALHLVDEYRRRPWIHALGILTDDRETSYRAAELAERMYERSALKRLLVHEGIGMALDRVRSHRIEVGVVTRLPHAFARKQIESTGLDRFLTVLAATPATEQWALAQRLAQCCGFTEHEPSQVDYVGAGIDELRAAARWGARPFSARWAVASNDDPTDHPTNARAIARAAEILDELLR